MSMQVPPELQRSIVQGELPPAKFSVAEIRCETVLVEMRDATKLATDVYVPPLNRAPVVVARTPYGRNRDGNSFVGALLAIARRGYVVVAQDCRGTGNSEPDHWDYYMFESEDSYDLIEWIGRQCWFDGFIGSFGSSYGGQTQWCMATHPAMSAISPGVSGLGFGINTVHLHMFVNAYARSMGKGAERANVPFPELERLMIEETLAGGYFNRPLYEALPQPVLTRFPELQSMSAISARPWLWKRYCEMTCAQRAAFVKEVFGIEAVTMLAVESLPAIFGQQISHDRHTLPNASTRELCQSIHAPPLLRTGWYDWALNDALATWALLRREGHPAVASGARMIISPHSHAMPGYREGVDAHPELLHVPNALETVGLLLRWYTTVREGAIAHWPALIYYLMGANEWRAAADWPVPESQPKTFYLRSGAVLSTEAPEESKTSAQYTYDPLDPPPTVGGSVVSWVYRPGSVDVSAVQRRSDVLVFTTPALEEDLDVVGPLQMILYASSSAPDTDFNVRLCDVFADGRAIQLQSGLLRARYRDPANPQLLEPGQIYRFEIDLWATANRFKKGHCLRVDICSADFPRFDRNSNRGGAPGEPVPAVQTIYFDQQRPSQLRLRVLCSA